MPRLNIGQLPVPPAAYRPDLLMGRGKERFETEDEAREEDQVRAKLLRQAANLAKHPENRIAALRLANRLDYESEERPASISSSLYMREQRICIVGALLQLADQFVAGDVATFHLTSGHWEQPGVDLAQFDPQRAYKALLGDFRRYGISAAEGGLFAFLDGEFEPNSDVWRPHFHGLAVGAKIEALDNLRTSQKYRSVRHRNQPGRSVQRLRVFRKPSPLSYRLPYLVKSFWPSRWEGWIDGEFRRSSKRCRIPEPRHSQLLLWFDRWSIRDFCVLQGLEVGSEGLRLSRKCTNKSVS